MEMIKTTTSSSSTSITTSNRKFPYRLYPKTTTRQQDDDEKRQATAMQHQETTSSSSITMGKNTNTTIQYSINLWAKMVDDYARANNIEEVILMGNSLGSLVALSAATGDFIHSPNDIDRENLFGYLAGNNIGERSRVKGICLFNCAVGLNSMNILKNTSYSDVQRTVFKVIFQLLNKLIFDNEWLLQYALRNVVTKELLRDALRGLYMCNPDRVDDELVDSFFYPAKLGGENDDDYGGVIEAIRQIYTNDAGLSPMELHNKYPEILNSIPLHLIWGNEDVVTPIEGDVGKFYCDRVANNRGGKGMTTIDVVKGGHILFDDNPVETHEAMMRWIQKKVL
jgi:pimeloyl-ACP methyl ester carboxylesterase